MNPNQVYSAGSSGNGGGGGVQVLNLSAASASQQAKNQAMLMELQAKQVASTIIVPTLPDDVRLALRELQCPIRLFGENLANVRDRLRMELARRQVWGQQHNQHLDGNALNMDVVEDDVDDEKVTKYTRASAALVDARQRICLFSLRQASLRLEKERTWRKACTLKRRRDTEYMLLDQQAALELEKIDQDCGTLYKSLQQVTLEGSQYGDSRTLSCIATQTLGGGLPIVATGSWTGSVNIWDGSSPDFQKIGQQTHCHSDRIMGLAMMVPDQLAGGSNSSSSSNEQTDAVILSTASIDLSAKIWKVQACSTSDRAMDCEGEVGVTRWTLSEQAQLRGHAARLCRTAFHPMKRHVATTSFDHSWRLWDIETTQEMLLLQDGHWKEVYGVGFHPDGSLCATTDFSGVVQVWDLRTGKSIRHFLGHAKRVLNAEFHPINGFQLATSGDDGTIKIWDLRRRKMTASIPAHSNLVTQLRFDPAGGEYLASSSFDNTVKLWSTRNWKMLNTLQGHEGKVTGVDILGVASNENKSSAKVLVSCGFDKTLKMWR